MSSSSQQTRWAHLTDEIKWAIWILKCNGIRASDVTKLSPFADDSLDEQYEVKKIIPQKTDRYDKLADELNKLWPAGLKDEKYRWRDTNKNISIRLKRSLEMRNLTDKTDDEILKAAKQYLSRFEESTKYMQILKYFILKEKVIANRMQYKSELCDILESHAADTYVDWEKIINENNLDYGETLG